MAIVTIVFHPFDDIGHHNIADQIKALFPDDTPMWYSYGQKTLMYEIDTTFLEEVNRWQVEGYNFEEFESFKYEGNPSSVGIPADLPIGPIISRGEDTV